MIWASRVRSHIRHQKHYILLRHASFFMISIRSRRIDFAARTRTRPVHARGHLQLRGSKAGKNTPRLPAGPEDPLTKQAALSTCLRREPVTRPITVLCARIPQFRSIGCHDYRATEESLARGGALYTQFQIFCFSFSGSRVCQLGNEHGSQPG